MTEYDVKAVIARLRDLLAGATAGPWKVYPDPDEGALHGRVVSPKGDAELGNWLVGDIRWAENRAFIAAARNELPALLDWIEKMLPTEPK